MSEPTTEAGRRLLEELAVMHADAAGQTDDSWWVNECRIADEEDIAAIEAEAGTEAVHRLVPLLQATRDHMAGYHQPPCDCIDRMNGLLSSIPMTDEEAIAVLVAIREEAAK